MLDLHNSRIAELVNRYGEPLRVEPAIASVAEAIEAGLKKQLRG